jgi:DNA-binding Xre family transcriptional regulator
MMGLCYNRRTRAGADFMIRLKVKEVAAERGISMRKLSKNAGIAYNTLRTIYHDPYRSVSTDTLDKIAQVLEVNASELLESVPNEL